MHAPVAVGQRVNVDKTECSHGTAHDRRLPLRAFQERGQALQHSVHVLGGRCHVVDDFLKANDFAHKHGRLANAKLLQGGALAQDFRLQLRQRGLVQRPITLACAACQHIGKTRNAVRLIGLAFDGKAGLALTQGHPDGRAHQDVFAKFRGQLL